MRFRTRRPYRPDLEILEELWMPSTFSPTQLAAAYGLAGLAFTSHGTAVKADGTGQTVAIVDAYHDPNLASDLAVFDHAYGLPAANLTQVVAPGTPSNDGWAQEEALDVEVVHALAPGARIVVVEARSASVSDLLAAVDTARNLPGVSVVSMSWGTNEFVGQSALDYHFTTPAGHTGVTFVASTGDGSAYAGASWPASSVNVLSVGGTTLSVTTSGAYAGESGWLYGGGGFSQVVREPSYQLSVQRTGARTTPDVSASANPAAGYSVYVTSPSNGQGGWLQAGGTSASAQLWAAVIAVVDQGRALAGLPTLDGPSQTLPAIYALPARDFHDVTGGFNGYVATPGYDLSTGRGSPVANLLVVDLVAFGAAAPPVVIMPVGPSASTGARLGLTFAATTTPVPTLGLTTAAVSTPAVVIAAVPPAASLPAQSFSTGLTTSLSTSTGGSLTTGALPTVVPMPLPRSGPVGAVLEPAGALIDPALAGRGGPMELSVFELLMELMFPSDLLD
jgi:subtilase family serine protease